MSNIIFPAGLIVDYRGLSMEMMQHYSKKWNLEHTKMEKGFFEARLLGVHTPRIQLGRSYYSHGVMTKGDFPKGCIVLTSYTTNNGTFSFQNRSILPNELMVLTRGDEIDRVTSGEVDSQIIVIEEELFYQAFYTFFGKEAHLFLKKKRFLLKADMISIFHQTINVWMDFLVHKLPTLNVKPEYDKIESEILSQLFNCITFASLKKDRKKFPIKMVRDLLHENIHQDIDLSAVEQELNISESQLYYAFKSSYGIAPKKYLKMIRLNAVKKELQMADPKHNTVTEIAMKYNFFHMNHFAEEYKKVFGQIPSVTLGK